MTVATLIVNPVAGRAARLAGQMPSIAALLARRGYAANVVETTAEPRSAERLAEEWAGRSSLVLACGGDGTVNGVVQGVAHSGTPLGVLPLGTANALATSLGLPAGPVAALERLLGWVPTTVPLGEMTTAEGMRLFVTMAGCGPSGALAEALAGGSWGKSRLGAAAYALHAARLFVTRRWPEFEVDCEMADGTRQTTRAAALLVSRVANLGGFLSRLTPTASLSSPTLQAHLLRAPAHLALPVWFAAAQTGLANRWLTVVEARSIRCKPLGAGAVLSQVDAELFGELPCTLRVVPGALRLLMAVNPSGAI